MAVLEVKDMKKNFGKASVLKGVSFSLEKGDVLAVIGSSGGGKTTLLRCINFLEFADGGTITVDGKIIYDAANKKKDQRSGDTEKQASFRARLSAVQSVSAIHGAEKRDACSDVVGCRYRKKYR